MRFRSVAALSFLFTCLFFFEYLPFVRWVDIPYDLQYYHYSLDDFAFHALRAGHIPEWDPTIYCGLSFVGNPQTALFYPPMWLAFIASIGHSRLMYSALEMTDLVHVWLAFLFCYLWLNHKKLHPLACVLGAGVFAYSGYLMLQLQHFGLVGGYTWMPLGLWSIDEALASRDWRPLWKLACAAALCFLAGYPPTFVVFCVCMLTYAAFGPMRWKAILGTGVALAFSLCISMVQLLPTRETLPLRVVNAFYGGGVRRSDFYVSYFIPNYFDFGLRTPIQTNPGGEYLYLGAPVFFGVLWLIFGRRSLRGQLPVLAIGVVCYILVNNPFGLVWAVLRHSDLLAQVVRSWYFLAGITLSAAGLAAAGLDYFLRQPSRPVPRWLTPLVIGLLAAWSVRQVWIWLPGGPEFVSGWRGAIDPLVMLALFSLAIFVLRAESGSRRIWLIAACLLAIGVDYKVFGTSKRVNAVEANMDHILDLGLFPGMNDNVYREMRSHPDFRVAMDGYDPVPTDLRHYGLTTPQGEDPLLPAEYLGVIPALANTPKWSYIMLDPANTDLLKMLGVRYFLTTSGQPKMLERLKARNDYHPVGSLDSYVKVFELSNAQPIYHWDPGQAQPVIWRAGRRDFKLHSDHGGQFVLVEQFFPGWRAAVDGKAVSIDRWNHAFQSIYVPPGDHRVSFTFHSRGLRIGAIISLISLVALPLLVKKRPFTAPAR